ncbi:HD domain-containing protein [Ferrimonas sediminum]|uniref:HD domain-containing protein n=1 Tax=Ferrimonas sediminum TaxID=718193 RepID=A0A1G9AFP1_9GAMM|nr:HD-GYP domain-containing protein [Ferrimonas sediminum]SDK26192.1 HD domain-containing protein [Ferrimonas sediminum]
MAVKELRVPISHLSVGQSVRLPLAWKEHPFLFNKFTIKDPQQIALIANLGLEYVFVQSRSAAEANTMAASLSAALAQSTSPTPSPEPSQEELQQQRQRQANIEYHRQIRKVEQAYVKALDLLRSAYAHLNSSADRSFAEASSAVELLLEQLDTCGEDPVLQLLAANQGNGGLQFHAINVCILSLVLARAAEIDSADIRLLALAALFHDVGKRRVPDSILNKRLALTKAEQSFVDAHPKLALDMLKGAALGHRRIREMVANHHEMLDGSGYPQGLQGNQICPLTQILIIANEYDALVNGSHKQLLPNQALAFLFKFKKDKLNPDYLQLLVKTLGIYPPGTLVRLSDGTLAKIMGTDSGGALSYRVMRYDSKIPRREAPVVTLEVLELQVEEAVQPQDLERSVLDYLGISSLTG